MPSPKKSKTKQPKAPPKATDAIDANAEQKEKQEHAGQHGVQLDRTGAQR
jgi:hypothetical protein